LVSFKESNKNGTKKRIKMREKGDLEFGNRLADSASELNLITTTTESEQTWHFLALLLSLGCPIRPAELA
jgi:hypothetical protein